MSKVAHKPVTSEKTAMVTANASLLAVKGLMSTAFGCITYIRCLLSEDNFHDAFLEDSHNPETVGASVSQSSFKPTRVKTVKRNFSTEADSLLDYLEVGIFDALEKQYLKSFVFAIYLDKDDPNNLIEAYTFNISYHKIEGSSIRVPVMNLESRLNRLGFTESADPVSQASTSGRPPTLGDVKKSIRALVRSLVTSVQAMEPLPDRRHATFKVFYQDDTPLEYEPPHFVAADAEKDRFFFTTRNVGQAPERTVFAGANAGHHGVRIEIASITPYLPSSEDHPETYTGQITPANTHTYNDRKRKADTDAEAQIVDAQHRRVVWNADPLEADAEGETDPEYMSQMPVGVRQGDGIIPVAMAKNVVRHEAGQHHVPTLDDAAALNADQPMDETQMLESQATVIVPSAVAPTEKHARVAEAAMEIDRSEDTQELRELIDARQDIVMSDVLQPVSPAIRGSNNVHDQASASQEEIAPAPVPQAIDPQILLSKAVDCDCKIEDENCETFVCQGPCGRRLHAWCAGFEDAETAATTHSSTCLNCVVRVCKDFELMSKENQADFLGALAKLALFRRVLMKVYKHGYPGNPHALMKLIGCTRHEAKCAIDRMEAEGFAETRTIQTDSLGLVISEVPVKNTKNKKKKTNKQPAKPKLVLIHSSAAKHRMKRYFEPRGAHEQVLVAKFRSKKDVRRAENAPVGNVLVPSSSLNIPSQEPAPALDLSQPLSAPPTPENMESQTQQESQIPEQISNAPPATPPSGSGTSSKRRSSARISQNQAKKMKISLATASVGLEACS